jgi:uncharacterized protein (TIGR02594 family)
MVELEGLEPKEAGKEVGETREAPQVGQEGQGNKLWGWTGSEWGYSASEVTVEGSKMSKSNSSMNIPINQGKDVSSISSSAPWMDVAKEELSKWNSSNSNESQGMIKKYLESAGVKQYPAAWCASFVTYCLKKAGISNLPKNPASAVSWKNWGTKLAQPAYGAIIGFDWKNDGTIDHVGFYVGIGKGRSVADAYDILHGNFDKGNLVETPYININSAVFIVYPPSYQPNYNIKIIKPNKGNFLYPPGR